MNDSDPVSVPPSESFAAKGIPHAMTFAAVLSSYSKTYSWRFDEALRHNTQNALAMRRDCYLMALLQERLLPSATMDWSIVPSDPKDPHQAEVASVFTKLLKAIPRWLQMQQSILQAVWYGRYAVQMHWGEVLVEGRRYWSILDHEPVNGDKLAFSWDKVPAVYINTSALGSYPPEWLLMTDRVPALSLRDPTMREKFIVHQHEVDDADYFEGEMAGSVAGIGLRSRIYWSQWLRDELLSWAVTTMERAGANGITVFWYEATNAAAKAAAENAARKFEDDNVLVMPRPSSTGSAGSWGIDNIPGNTTGIESLQNMIQGYFESNMERLIVGQSLSSGTEGSGLGGTGVAALHADTKYQLIRFDCRNRDETVTRDLLGPLLRHNYPNCPFELEFRSSIPDPSATEKLASVQTAISMGISFSADSVRELTGLPKPAEGDEQIGGPQGQPGQPGQAGGGGDGIDTDSDSPFSDMLGNGSDDDDSKGGPEPYSRVTYGWEAIHYAEPHSDWMQSAIKSGPRKGQLTWRNNRTGAIRDKPPSAGGSQASPEGAEHQPSTAGAKQFQDLAQRAEASGVKSKAVGAHADEIFRQYRDGGMDPKEAASKAVEETGQYIDGMSDPTTRAKMVGARDTWNQKNGSHAAIAKLIADGHLSHMSPKHRREAIEEMGQMGTSDVMDLAGRHFKAPADNATFSGMAGQAFDRMPDAESHPFDPKGRYTLVSRDPRGTHIDADGDEAGEEEDADTKLYNDSAESMMGKLPTAGGTLMGSRIRLVPEDKHDASHRSLDNFFAGTHMSANPVDLSDPEGDGASKLWDATDHLQTKVALAHVPKAARSSSDLADANETLDMTSVPRYRRLSRDHYLQQEHGRPGARTSVVHKDEVPELSNIKKEHLDIVGTDAEKFDQGTIDEKMGGDLGKTREQRNADIRTKAVDRRGRATQARTEERDKKNAEGTDRRNEVRDRLTEEAEATRDAGHDEASEAADGALVDHDDELESVLDDAHNLPGGYGYHQPLNIPIMDGLGHNADPKEREANRQRLAADLHPDWRAAHDSHRAYRNAIADGDHDEAAKHLDAMVPRIGALAARAKVNEKGATEREELAERHEEEIQEHIDEHGEEGGGPEASQTQKRAAVENHFRKQRRSLSFDTMDHLDNGTYKLPEEYRTEGGGINPHPRRTQTAKHVEAYRDALGEGDYDGAGDRLVDLRNHVDEVADDAKSSGHDDAHKAYTKIGEQLKKQQQQLHDLEGQHAGMNADLDDESEGEPENEEGDEERRAARAEIDERHEKEKEEVARRYPMQDDGIGKDVSAEDHQTAHETLTEIAKQVKAHRRALGPLATAHRNAKKKIDERHAKAMAQIDKTHPAATDDTAQHLSRAERVLQYIQGQLRSLYEWSPHVIGRGPRKGSHVWKESATGQLSDTRPVGRVAKTATVASAKALIERHNYKSRDNGTGGAKVTPEAFKEIVSHLSELTVAEIHTLKRQLGIRTSAGTKSALAGKLADLATKETTEREKWKRTARSMGIPPKHLFERASEIRNIDRRTRDAVVGAIKYARDRYKSTHGKNLNRNDRSFREGDYSTVKSWDEIAESAREAFPDAFPYDDGSVDFESHLYDFVVAGVPRLLEWKGYYAAALKSIVSADSTRDWEPLAPARRGAKKDDDDFVPFSRSGERSDDLLRAWLELTPEQMQIVAYRVQESMEDTSDGIEGAGDPERARSMADALLEERLRADPGQSGPIRAYSDDPNDPEIYEWVPWTVKSGPRKGSHVWKDTASGSLRDTAPQEHRGLFDEPEAPKPAAPKPAEAKKPSRAKDLPEGPPKHTLHDLGANGYSIPPAKVAGIRAGLGGIDDRTLTELAGGVGEARVTRHWDDGNGDGDFVEGVSGATITCDAMATEGIRSEAAVLKLPNGLKLMKLVLMEIAPSSPWKGMGSLIFERQVAAAIRGGIGMIKCNAHRDEDHNGHYTWARLGFTGAIPAAKLAEIPADLRAEMGDKNNVWYLMKTDAGRKWWQVNGCTMDMTFDTSANSASMATLKSYMAERRKASE